LCSQPAERVGFEAEEVLADRFEMLLPALQLLRDGVDVTETALERVLLENRGRSGGVIGGIDDTQRLMDRKGRCQADRHPLVEGEPAGLRYFTGDLFE